MKTLPKILISLFILAILFAGAFALVGDSPESDLTADVSDTLGGNSNEKPTPLPPPPTQKVLPINYHAFQTFNNCAPAALSIALSYYGVNVSQEKLAAALRPYNNLQGVNDDKSTPPNELGEQAKEYGLVPYFRAHGTVELLTQLIANDFPVVIRTLLESGKDYAHYRVIKGYDATTKELIQDDSFQGKNIRYSYDAFLELWKPFNYAYLVLARPEQQALLEKILGKEADSSVAWENALRTAGWELEIDKNDITAGFNAAVARYYLKDYEGAVREFERVEPALPMRAMWYQIEPIEAYFEVGNYARVFSLSENILNNNNPAFTELYILRGMSYVAQGKLADARNEFEKAVLYNKNSKAAEKALNSLGN